MEKFTFLYLFHVRNITKVFYLKKRTMLNLRYETVDVEDDDVGGGGGGGGGDGGDNDMATTTAKKIVSSHYSSWTFSWSSYPYILWCVGVVLF
jgi:hypothetical protein